MSLFDQYLIVDWSANNTPKRGADSIWICLVDDRQTVLRLENPATRSDAFALIVEIFENALAKGTRVFSGFDFGFGYPHGASERIAQSANWNAVWSRLSDWIQDDDANQSNRFDVGGRLNRECFDGLEGPFWGQPHQHTGRYDGLDGTRPGYDIVSEKRIVETIVSGAQPVWKLAYTGSVGSQTLLGIPRLQSLRNQFGDKLKIWPFETRFGEDLETPLTVAEIYPSLLPVSPQDGEVKDAAQVRTMAMAFSKWDKSDQFHDLLSCPSSLSQEQREAVLAEEGWIVGVGHSIPSDMDYIKDPAEIYRQSFATVREEADLARLPEDMQSIATRLIHSCGMVDILDDLAFSAKAARAGYAAFQSGKPVFCDVEMVRSGIIERLMPADNELICTLNNVQVPDHAKTIGNTRSAAAVDFWGDDLEGAVVAIGNAPTALFRLLERIADGAPKPALVIGIPVGFVGAVESKAALAANQLGLNFITVHGRRGGSAMASSVVNALAGGLS